jgi:hypothetical protein
VTWAAGAQSDERTIKPIAMIGAFSLISKQVPRGDAEHNEAVAEQNRVLQEEKAIDPVDGNGSG